MSFGRNEAGLIGVVIHLSRGLTDIEAGGRKGVLSRVEIIRVGEIDAELMSPSAIQGIERRADSAVELLALCFVGAINRQPSAEVDAIEISCRVRIPKIPVEAEGGRNCVTESKTRRGVFVTVVLAT